MARDEHAWPVICYSGIDVEAAIEAVHAERQAEFEREQRLVFGAAGPKHKGCKCTTRFSCGVCSEAACARRRREEALWAAQQRAEEETRNA